MIKKRCMCMKSCTYSVFYFMFFNTQIRMADDKLVSGVRVESICAMIDATDFFWRNAILCRASINSGSMEMDV